MPPLVPTPSTEPPGRARSSDLGPISRYFLANLHPDAEFKRARLLLIASILLTLSSLISTTSTLLMGTTQLTPFLFTAALICASVPFFLRRGWHLRPLTRLICAAAVLCMGAVAPMTGGVTSNAVLVLLLVPLLASFLVGWQEARGWAALCVVYVVALATAETMGVEMINVVAVERRPGTHAAALVLVFVAILVFCRDYVRYRIEAGGRLRRADALRAMVGGLTTREASVQDAAEALSADGGLTAAMLQQATTGDLETREAHAQVDTLVESFESVARLVGAMLEQVRTVDDLVDGAQRVARRLDMLSLNASLEATKTGEASFGLVAEEIGRVTATVKTDLGRMREGTMFFQSQLDELAALHSPSRELAERVRNTMTHNSRSFAALSSLIGEVAAATARLESEAGDHLKAVREVADAAVEAGAAPATV